MTANVSHLVLRGRRTACAPSLELDFVFAERGSRWERSSVMCRGMRSTLNALCSDFGKSPHNVARLGSEIQLHTWCIVSMPFCVAGAMMFQLLPGKYKFS